MRNLITDVAGLRVGHGEDRQAATGVTAVLFDQPTVAAVTIPGGAPGGHDLGLLEPGRSVEHVDAIFLAGGSAHGLTAAAGLQHVLAAEGRGFPVGRLRVPIVVGAILFDLANGGDKDWGENPPYAALAAAAARTAGPEPRLGSHGAGLGATTANLKGGIGSASAVTSAGYTVGALAAVNAIGEATIADGPHFWAAPDERHGEFGGLGWPGRIDAHRAPRLKGESPGTTLAVVATDATLTRPEAYRLALMASAGLARALRPVFLPQDGDTVFAAATARKPRLTQPTLMLNELGHAAACTLARAIARGVHSAERLPYPGALPAWRDRFAQT